jgi:hypothetical protein
MDVLSLCPLRVASILWQPRAGAWALTVACKATYTLAPGESPLTPDQEEPSQADFYWDDDERRSLYLASDLAPFKRCADVILVGSAYAPGRHPVGSLLARLTVGEVDKAIAVFGDRVFTHHGELLGPAPFVRMPLVWERAGGGPGTVNPVGVALSAAPDVHGRSPVPNLQPPGAYITTRRDLVEPVSFGPIPPTWPSRTQKLHRHAARWSHRRWHEQPLPDDIDAGYFNAAPPDQQRSEIRPDERIALENLHPDHPRLVTQLLALVPRARVEGSPGAVQETKLRCDTLWIDTDRGTCSLTWRAYVPLEHPHQAGRVVVWLAEGARPSWIPGPPGGYEKAAEPSPELGVSGGARAPFARDTPDRDAGAITLSGQRAGVDAAKPVLPFVDSRTPWPASPPIEPASSAPPPPGEVMEQDSRHRTLPGTQRSPLFDALPFVAAGAAASSVTRAPAVAAVPPSPMPPPIAPMPPMVPIAPMPPMPPPPMVSSLQTPTPTPPPPRMPTPPPSAPMPAPEVVEPELPPLVGVAKPAMIGPLAAPEASARPEAREAAPLETALAARSPEVQPEEARGPSLDEFPVERFAEVSASLALRPDEKETIFEINGLTEPSWARLRAAWDAEIKGALRRGRSQKLRAYDAAYVAQLEKERGPISVDELARITVGVERGDAAEALREVGLPEGSAIHIQRTWIGRVASDPALGAAVRKAVEKARAG